MRILLDNCVDWRASRLFPDHDVKHAKDLGWANLENGLLLSAAATAGYDVMITVDKKIKYEQNLDRLPLTVMELDLHDSRLPSITAIARPMNDALALVTNFWFISVAGGGEIENKAPRAGR